MSYEVYSGGYIQIFNATCFLKDTFNSTIANKAKKDPNGRHTSSNDNSVPLNIAFMLCTTHIVTGVF